MEDLEKIVENIYSGVKVKDKYENLINVNHEIVDIIKVEMVCNNTDVQINEINLIEKGTDLASTSEKGELKCEYEAKAMCGDVISTKNKPTEEKNSSNSTLASVQIQENCYNILIKDEIHLIDIENDFNGLEDENMEGFNCTTEMSLYQRNLETDKQSLTVKVENAEGENNITNVCKEIQLSKSGTDPDIANVDFDISQSCNDLIQEESARLETCGAIATTVQRAKFHVTKSLIESISKENQEVYNKNNSPHIKVEEGPSPTVDTHTDPTGDLPYLLTHRHYKAANEGCVENNRTHKPQNSHQHANRASLSVSHSLKSHIQPQAEGKPLRCNQCSYTASFKCHLIRHMGKHTGDKPYTCTQCTYKSSLKSNLAKHLRTHTRDQPYSCTYKASTSRIMMRHVKTHTGDKLYSCTQCTYEASVKYKLITHMRTHTEYKSYSCAQCTYKASQLGHMKRHMKTHTGDKPYSCAQCTYKSSQKCDLTKHMRTHTGDKPYSCTQCTYKASVNYRLIRHMKTHTGDKPHSCTQCTYKSSEKSDLEKHIRTHTGYKPYSCSQCTYKASQKCDLTKHVKTHTGDKPYSCTHCTYKTSRKGYLLTHMRRHIGDKPYSCTNCTFKALLKSELITHMRTHTVEKPYILSQCTYKASVKSTLEKHIRAH